MKGISAMIFLLAALIGGSVSFSPSAPPSRVYFGGPWRRYEGLSTRRLRDGPPALFQSTSSSTVTKTDVSGLTEEPVWMFGVPGERSRDEGGGALSNKQMLGGKG